VSPAFNRASLAWPQPHAEWSGFHAFRRKVGDGAQASTHCGRSGGGRLTGTDTLVRCYQQVDEATMLAVVMSAGVLREQALKVGRFYTRSLQPAGIGYSAKS
jgi:hypothetical protein